MWSSLFKNPWAWFIPLAATLTILISERAVGIYRLGNAEADIVTLQENQKYILQSIVEMKTDTKWVRSYLEEGRSSSGKKVE